MEKKLKFENINLVLGNIKFITNLSISKDEIYFEILLNNELADSDRRYAISFFSKFGYEAIKTTFSFLETNEIIFNIENSKIISFRFESFKESKIILKLDEVILIKKNLNNVKNDDYNIYVELSDNSIFHLYNNIYNTFTESDFLNQKNNFELNFYLGKFSNNVINFNDFKLYFGLSIKSEFNSFDSTEIKYKSKILLNTVLENSFNENYNTINTICSLLSLFFTDFIIYNYVHIINIENTIEIYRPNEKRNNNLKESNLTFMGYDKLLRFLNELDFEKIKSIEDFDLIVHSLISNEYLLDEFSFPQLYIILEKFNEQENMIKNKSKTYDSHLKDGIKKNDFEEELKSLLLNNFKDIKDDKFIKIIQNIKREIAVNLNSNNKIKKYIESYNLHLNNFQELQNTRNYFVHTSDKYDDIEIKDKLHYNTKLIYRIVFYILLKRMGLNPIFTK